MRAWAAAALLWIGAAFPSLCSAQVPEPAREDVRLPAPEPSPAKKRKGKDNPPLALALDLAFGPTVWAQVQISTAGPVVELSKLVKEGYYKLELIQLILMSSQSKRPLKELLEKRRKGAKLAEIAWDLGLDYEKLYGSALAVQELVDKEYLPRFPETRLRRAGEEP
ncbi:MAG: hypothetical protein HY549_04180 [Elusimicrobia bacterium]|nr:hypothetical protein [Elusimicrobiota bacterium]